MRGVQWLLERQNDEGGVGRDRIHRHRLSQSFLPALPPVCALLSADGARAFPQADERNVAALSSRGDEGDRNSRLDRFGRRHHARRGRLASAIVFASSRWRPGAISICWSDQVERFSPELVSVATAELARDLKRAARPVVQSRNSSRTRRRDRSGDSSGGRDRDVGAGRRARTRVPRSRAIEAGKDIAFANKEVLVIAGEVMTRAVREQRRAPAAGRQRAQRDFPMPRRTRPRHRSSASS